MLLIKLNIYFAFAFVFTRQWWVCIVEQFFCFFSSISFTRAHSSACSLTHSFEFVRSRWLSLSLLLKNRKKKKHQYAYVYIGMCLCVCVYTTHIKLYYDSLIIYGEPFTLKLKRFAPANCLRAYMHVCVCIYRNFVCK